MEIVYTLAIFNRSLTTDCIQDQINFEIFSEELNSERISNVLKSSCYRLKLHWVLVDSSAIQASEMWLRWLFSRVTFFIVGSRCFALVDS